ncbi:MAG: Smr/MutS family protein [Saprospiraceae bacterium]
MVFAIGTKVRFIHTGEVGVVTAWLDGGMVNVRVDDFEIPAFMDDIIRIDDVSTVKAKVIQGKQEKTPEPAPQLVVETQYTILKSIGIQLAFEPMWDKDGNVNKYRIYLLNDTRYDILYDYEFSILNGKSITGNGKLKGVSYLFIGEMLFDQLNDSPVFDMECQLITTAGVEKPMHKTLKIRAKQFFSQVKTAPLLNKPVHLFRVFENLQAAAQAEEKEDLKTYTQRNARPTNSWRYQKDQHEVEELAHFNPEIDLHIENLVENPKKLNKAEILNIQILHFERFIDKALRLGVERVFVIHGVGEGKLRDAISTRLLQMPEVKSFKNEYHPRYGYGATEVIF